jgi:hypothetical protein
MNFSIRRGQQTHTQDYYFWGAQTQKNVFLKFAKLDELIFPKKKIM